MILALSYLHQSCDQGITRSPMVSYCPRPPKETYLKRWRMLYWFVARAGGTPTAPNRGPDIVVVYTEVQAINYTVRQRSGQSSVD